MKLKIVSEGTAETTKVVNAETGEEVEDITSIELSADAFNIEAAVVFSNPHLSINNLSYVEFTNVQELMDEDKKIDEARERESQESDSTGDDGRTGDPDNQQHSEPTSFQV